MNFLFLLGVGYLTDNTNHVAVTAFILLSGFMFLRLFLLCRGLTLHSRFNSNAYNECFASLSNVSTGFHFVSKNLLLDYPLPVISTVFFLMLFISSFFMHTCETIYEREENPLDYLDSLWLVVVTFLTVGYGDLTPKSFCGRTVSVLIGFIGVIITAYIIAVVTQDMELTRSQKHASNFLTKFNLNKQMRNSAANIIRNAWLIYRYKSRGLIKKMKAYEVKYYESVREYQAAKDERDELVAASVDMYDIHLMSLRQVCSSLTLIVKAFYILCTNLLIKWTNTS